LYSTGKLAEMSETLREISGLRVREVPTYEMHFYEALELAQQNRRDEALARLAAFRDMLRIDSGVAKCEATNGAISVGGVKKASSEAYNAMCAEAFIAYYDNPTYESLRRITRYWAFADDLRMKIERKT